MNKTKIVFIDHTPFAGGAQLRLAEDLKFLNREKIEPSLLIDKSSKFEEIYKNSQVPIYKIPFSRLNLLHPVAIPRLVSSIRSFNKIIQKLEPDIVMANTTRALLIAALAAKVYRSDYKLISYIRDYDYPKWIFQLVGDEVAKYLFVSKDLRSFYNLNGQVIYLGSNLKPSVESKKNQKSKFTVGYLGRLVDWKGGEVLLKAFNYINRPDMQLVFWGTGKGQNGSIEDRLRKHSNSSIQFEGFIPRPETAFKKMSCYILPSQKPEPFATSVIEAALSKVPIIATDTGGTSEFIKNGKNGLLVKPGDTNQLASALLRLKEDPEFAHKLAEQAFLDAQKFTETEFIKKLEKSLLI